MIYCAEKETIAVDATNGKEKKDEGLSYFTMDFFKLGNIRRMYNCRM